MKLPMSWLKDFMDTDGIDAESYERKMTMSGSKVEKIENRADEIKNVVVGKIEKIEKHPDADKLVVCRVNVGEEAPLQIVTGAPNAFEGAYVVVAKHKSTLPGGVKITKGKLRGVESAGMMCSTDELGISETRADGILILPDDAPIGEDICKYLKLDENVVEFEITSNRPDCMSVIGLAKETAATFGRKFTEPDNSYPKSAKKAADSVSVEVKDFSLCPRYTARLVENVKIAPSPEWMQKRLRDCGLRPINNVVDITNYVMLEYGQPMHSYDFDQIKGGKIIVRAAKDGELLETLDDKPHELDSTMIVISDEERAIGVAGIMGGANTEVSDSTTRVLFEAATFSGVKIRRAAKKLGMRTDASALFEKGLDPENASKAMERACKLLSDMGGEVLDGMIDVRCAPKEPLELKLDDKQINGFLGMDIPREEMVKILESLEFKVESDGTVIVPSFRGDIETYADIAEEIVRIYGYDKIPTVLMNSRVTTGGKNRKQQLEDKAKSILTSLGFFEIMTYSFTDPKLFDDINVPANSPLRNTVKIINPLGEENSIMRTTLIPTTLEVLKTNYSRRIPSASVFELGTRYIPVDGQQLPDEIGTLSLGMYGEVDFYDLKGAVCRLLERLGVPRPSFMTEKQNPTFHPGRCAVIAVKNKIIGVIGQIHPRVAKNYKMNTEIYLAELDFGAILPLCSSEITYTQLPKFPSTSRDIAMVLDDSINVADIEKIIEENAGKILESYKLFDVYRGEQVGENKKSVAYSITFRAADRTLVDDEVSAVMNKIVNALETKLGATLRA